MSQSERRIRQIAVGCAVVAMIVALLAVFIVATRRADPAGSAALPARHVPASELARLAPETVQEVGEGLRVTDAALRAALGLSRDDIVLAISGRPVPGPAELEAVVRELARFRPADWFVELARDRARVVERWQLDGDLEAARRARPPAPPDPARPASDPLIASVRRLDATTYELPRSTVEAWTADPVRITAGIASARHLRNPDGFQIVTVRPGSAIAALGIQDGDQIRGLNGVELASIDKIAPIIARSTSRISLDLRRGDRTIILNYLIR